MFYFDGNLKRYEAEYSWDKSLLYLERSFQEEPTTEKLNSLVGFAWYYLIEGPIDSKKYGNDENIIALDIWEKYLDVGFKQYFSSPGFCFVAGYSLLMHGFYLEKYKINYQQVGIELLNKAIDFADKNLQEVVNVILKHLKQRKYKPLKVKHDVLEQIFRGESLLEGYFKELYADCC